MISNNLIKLNPDNKEHVEAVSKLHISLLPESIVSKLGFFFLSNFYYKALTKNNLIDVFLYKYNNNYVGFISCTDYPFTFMKIGIKLHFLRLSIVLLISILLKPNRILFLLRMRDDLNLNFIQKKYGENIGQFMSFGVLEKFRKHIDENTKLTIANVLMRKVFSHFRYKNKHLFFLLVLKTNNNAITFYKKYNGVFLFDNKSKSAIVKFDLYDQQ